MTEIYEASDAQVGALLIVVDLPAWPRPVYYTAGLGVGIDLICEELDELVGEAEYSAEVYRVDSDDQSTRLYSVSDGSWSLRGV